MSKQGQETRAIYGEPPSDDPIERAGHVIKVYMDLNVGGTTNESEVLVTATKNAYGQGVWTGMTWGDLRKLWALAEQAGPALEMLVRIDAVLNSVKAPIVDEGSGGRLNPAERVLALLRAPFQPRREDAIERWLKRMRDKAGPTVDSFHKPAEWDAINILLDRYRECSDHGLSLEPEDDGKGDQ